MPVKPGGRGLDMGANEPPPGRQALRFAHDDAREIAAVLQQVGGFAPDSLRQLSEISDVIVTMLPTSVIVERVLAEIDGIKY